MSLKCVVRTGIWPRDQSGFYAFRSSVHGPRAADVEAADAGQITRCTSSSTPKCRAWQTDKTLNHIELPYTVKPDIWNTDGDAPKHEWCRYQVRTDLWKSVSRNHSPAFCAVSIPCFRPFHSRVFVGEKYMCWNCIQVRRTLLAQVLSGSLSINGMKMAGICV
jgi:hypothetical protein